METMICGLPFLTILGFAMIYWGSDGGSKIKWFDFENNPKQAWENVAFVMILLWPIITSIELFILYIFTI